MVLSGFFSARVLRNHVSTFSNVDQCKHKIQTHYTNFNNFVLSEGADGVRTRMKDILCIFNDLSNFCVNSMIIFIAYPVKDGLKFPQQHSDRTTFENEYFQQDPGQSEEIHSKKRVFSCPGYCT